MTERKMENSRSIAAQAFSRIEALGLRSDPSTFEVFYTYFAGTKPQLVRELDGVVSLKGSTSIQTDVDALYARLFNKKADADDVEEAGDRLTEVLTTAISSIAEAVDQTGEAYLEIDNARRGLDTRNPKSIYLFAERLVAATVRIQDGNQALQGRLKASRTEIETLRNDLEAARENSVRDALTEVFNRRYFDDKVASIVASGKRRPTSLLMIDIDYFKDFNDRLGHLMGDQVLRMVANCLQTCAPQGQTVARYGGEEFAIVLEDTPLEEAAEFADLVRRTIQSRDIRKKSSGDLLGRLTVSIGVSTLRPGDSREAWISRADKALYRSKRNGRNRVLCEDDERDVNQSPALRAVG